jgi:hypothetical protein
MRSTKSLRDLVGPGTYPRDFLSFPRGPAVPPEHRNSLKFALSAFDPCGLPPPPGGDALTPPNWPSSFSTDGWQLVAVVEANGGGKHRVFQGQPECCSSNFYSKWAEDVQGITFGGGHWFITQTKTLHKLCDCGGLPQAQESSVDMPEVLNPPSPFPLFPLPYPYDHFGDPCFFGDRVFVPIEAVEKNRPGVVAVFDGDSLSYLPQASSPLVLSNGTVLGDAPWCAVNPWDSLLYTSRFNPFEEASETAKLYAFDPFSRRTYSFQEWGALGLHPVVFVSHGLASGVPLDDEMCQLALTTLTQSGIWLLAEKPYSVPYPMSLWTIDVYPHVKTIQVPYKLHHVQGGCFSEKGQLYLSMDYYDTDREFGDVVCLEMLKGNCLGGSSIFVDKSLWQELEGLCLFQASNGDVLLYVLQWDKELGKSDERAYLRRRIVSAG